MALARIITRSHQCSRELALDLLARGYAVEIVSPDAIPDNIADLELRVETAPGDQLIASVEAHDGPQSSSLDFVHHLKSPMVDFIRRPPDLDPLPSDQFADLPEQRILFKVEPRVEHVVAPPKTEERTLEAAAPAAAIVHDAELVRAESTLPIASPVPGPPPPMEPPRYLAVEDAPAARTTVTRSATIPSKTITPATLHPPLVAPRRTAPHRARSASWRWRAALIFASVVLLAVVLGFGMRRIGRAAAQNSVQSYEPISEPSFSQASVVSLPPPGVSAEANFAPPPKPSELAKPKASAPKATPRATPRARIAPRIARPHTDDVIARDTVTYLDDRYRPASQPKPANRVASRQPKAPKHSKAVIAASSVTYLKKPKSKTTK